MKTFETEKGNIPEGATHYREDGFLAGYSKSFAWFKSLDGINYQSDSEQCGEWREMSDHYDMYELCVKPIPETNIETTEDKDVEWNSGDKCIYMGDEFLFVGMIPTLDDFSCVIFSDTHGAKRATTIELSKPETEAERVERERLEAAEDLYITYMSKWEFAQDWRALDEINKSAFLAIVDKTNYRMESE